MELFNTILTTTNDFLTGYVLLIALVGGGIWFTVQTGFVQIREFRNGFRRVFGGMFRKKESGGAKKDGISSFQALTTAVAAQVGTGNLAGAATAIATGGPGAIFWMWISAFLGMATIFCEATLAQVYRTTGPDGKVTGGPVYYIRAVFKGKGGRVLAAFFAVMITLALGFFGNAVQANSITDAFHTAFFSSFNEGFQFMGELVTWDDLIIGILLAITAWLIFGGGITRIAAVTEKLVPIMACFYLVGGLIIVLLNIQNVPYMFVTIVEGAFNPQAVCGGVFGVAMKEAVKKGVARGLFSNEAGMGSTPNAHAQASVAHPVQQGQVAIVSVFIDTFLVLNMTAFVIIGTKILEPGSAAYNSDGAIKMGISLTQTAFNSVYGQAGSIFIAICMLFFAFSTILGWYFFGETNIKYLFGPKAVKPYIIVVCLFIVLGSMMKVETIWNMSDCFNSLMVVPNIIGVFALTGVVKKTYKDYRDNFLPNHPEER
ncbi:MAG: sodium:alanine symporter family protein [Eubacteriales bacterium]|nr:sodium:alanine symporter family protein [Eubacteriales bacterium]